MTTTYALLLAGILALAGVSFIAGQAERPACIAAMMVVPEDGRARQ